MRRWQAVWSMATAVVLVSPAAAQAEPRSYQAMLSGKQVAPRPGDPDGTGKALITIDTSINRLCYELSWSNIGEPTDAMIHDSSIKDENTSMLIDLRLKENGPKACLTVDRPLLDRVVANPSGHHVEVHNNDYPDGAMRGQLSPA